MATNPFDRVVCLNVDRRYGEQGRIREDFSRVGLRVDFFLAGDGKLVDAPYDRIDIEPPEGRTGYPAFVKRPNSYNAFLSFLQIIAKAQSDGVDTLLLLEDDAYPTPEYSSHVYRVWSEVHAVDPEWEILMLGGNHCFAPTREVAPHLLRVNGSGCWHGIVLHRRVFPLVLALQPTAPIDGLAGEKIHPRNHSYAAWPSLIWVRPGLSLCEGREVSYDEFRLRRRL
jgi:hypothetical protein